MINRIECLFGIYKYSVEKHPHCPCLYFEFCFMICWSKSYRNSSKISFYTKFDFKRISKLIKGRDKWELDDIIVEVEVAPPGKEQNTNKQSWKVCLRLHKTRHAYWEYAGRESDHVTFTLLSASLTTKALKLHSKHHSLYVGPPVLGFCIIPS